MGAGSGDRSRRGGVAGGAREQLLPGAAQRVRVADPAVRRRARVPGRPQNPSPSREEGLEDALGVFESSDRSEHSWSTIIGAFAKNGRKKEALDLYRRFRGEGARPSGSSVLISAMAACSCPDDLAEGREIHRAIVSAGWLRRSSDKVSDTILETAVFSMYARCGSMDEAREIFDRVPDKDVVCYTIMISAYAQKGYHREALELYEEMDERGVDPNDKTFACVLSACAGLKDMERGKKVHRRIRESVARVDTVLQNALLNLYAKCGDLEESRRIFEAMERRTVATWNTMITAYVQHDFFQEALEAFRRMDAPPSSITFTSVLGACCSPDDLETGKAIHRQIGASSPQIQADEILQNSLVTMYGKCGSLEDAERVFHGIRRKNAFSWTAMITAYAQNGYERRAIEVFGDMMSEGRVEPDPITYAGVLTACSTLGDLETGMRIHALIRSKGVESAMVSTGLIDLYGKWGFFEDALQVFESVRDRDVVIWTAFIAACVYHGQSGFALELFRKMEAEGLQANNVTFSKILAACSNLEDFETGKTIEDRIYTLGLEYDDVLQDGILSLHARCGSLVGTREMFDRMPHRTVVTWTTMIAAYNQRGYSMEALELYHCMDIEPDDIALSNVLQACSRLKNLEQGRAVHSRIASRDFEPSLMVQTLLVDMYVKCGDLAEARRTFDGFKARDVISWTSLITAYSHENFGREALEVFHSMELEGVEPNSITFCTVIDACSRLSSLLPGRALHSRVVATGHISDEFVGNALVSMYSKFGRVDFARVVFDSIPVKRYPSWRVMLVALTQNGHSHEALEMYSRIHLEGFRPGSPIFSAALVSCTALEDVSRARAIHGVIKSSDFYPDLVLSNVLMNVYAKCGELEEARLVFDQMTEKNEVSWTTMIGGYAQNGRPAEALELYKAMDVQPNFIAFVPVISSCADLGALVEGQRVHARLSDAGLQNNEVIVTALVNMYAKCGKLGLAREFFDSTYCPDAGAWNSMATAYAQFGHGSQVLELYREMCLQGVQPNGITLLSVLVACSHMGMLEECEHRFECMVADHGIAPTSEHYSCMTDLLGRSGRLEEAEKVVKMASGESGSEAASPVAVSAWMSFLGACKTHNDWGRAAGAAEKLYELDPEDSAPYVLLSQTYSPRAKK
ncbi:pentatricopeptide repeat-containing protein At5g27110 [Selaginella moellendorffii]|nr:pentatricopeptide repeat-containing protein At5g27110 [Selaginella moellendorffii]|eukprot:XP_002974666.2 pentatricopeptide repeat-containing protein At5g27110 [Selaginella moellendorffii]